MLVLPEDGGVNDVGPVGCPDDEDVLLAAHAVHLCEDLVDDAVAGAPRVSGGSASRLRDTVQLVKEEHARCSRTCLTNKDKDALSWFRIGFRIQHFRSMRIRIQRLYDQKC